MYLWFFYRLYVVDYVIIQECVIVRFGTMYENSELPLSFRLRHIIRTGVMIDEDEIGQNQCKCTPVQSLLETALDESDDTEFG